MSPAVGAALLRANGVMQQVPQAATVVTPPIIKSPAISLMAGESLFVRFSIKTDTVLKVVNTTTVTPRGCGLSWLFIRVWKRFATATHDSAVVFADSIVTQARLTTVAAPSDTTVSLSQISCTP